MPRLASFRRRPTIRQLAAVVAVLGASGAAGAGVWSWLDADLAPAGTSVGGIRVEGLDRDSARSAVARRARALADRPVSVGALGTTSGRELGASARIEAALDHAFDVGLLDRLRAKLGVASARAIPLRFALDPVQLESLAQRLDRAVARPALDARVVVGPRSVRVVPDEPGRQVDRAALARQLRSLPGAIDVEIRVVSPTIDTREAERARQTIERLLAQPRSVALGSISATLSPAVLRRLVRLEPTAAGLAVSLDDEELARRLRRPFRALERPARDARFAISGTRARIVPARDGRTLDGERIAASVARNLSSTVHRARFEAVRPALGTRAAQRLRIRELVSEFTTYYPCCAPRVTNIRRAAALLDGTILEPRERFSMNGALGRRTEERGFVSAPQIYAGRLEDAVGGGISQVATTLYNAAFFAGLRLDSHTPHQFYIDRYPMGREATVSWGGPELVFTNNWPAGLLLKVSAGDTSISVRMYSARLGRRVETETGEPYDFVAPTTRVIQVSGLPPGARNVVQDLGSSGFSVDYTRRVFRGRTLARRERFHVEYDPKNAIVEVGPPARKTKPKRPTERKTPAKPRPDEAPATSPPAP